MTTHRLSLMCVSTTAAALVIAGCPGGKGMDSPADDETMDGGLDSTADTGGTNGDSTGSDGDDTDDGGDVVDDGDDWVDGVEVAVHDEVNTILVVTWNQVVAADEVWLEFTFEGETMRSRPQPGTAGSHRDVVLGVPGETNVTVRIISAMQGTGHRTSDYAGRTEAVPSGMPTPTILAYDASGASPERWMFGSVEDTICGNSCGYYRNIFWVYIMDRRGRVVWYYAEPESNISSAFQRVARDGEYIVIDKGRLNDTGVVRMTLDWEYYEETPMVVGDCIDVTDEGFILHDDGDGTLLETDPDTGTTREIWNCEGTINGTCYSNTVNWNPLDDTVLMSFPYSGTVVEIDRQSGDTVSVWGDLGDWEFMPSSLGFEFNHFPTITPDGTLLVSSHMPGYDTEEPVAGQHAFMEFDIDRENQRLVQRWLYREGPEWPRAKGMAIRLSNGNTLANYGTGGVIREITPYLDTVFHVKFDIPVSEGGDNDDFFNKMVNHNVMVDDLYSLNGGRD